MDENCELARAYRTCYVHTEMMSPMLHNSDPYCDTIQIGREQVKWSERLAVELLLHV